MEFPCLSWEGFAPNHAGQDAREEWDDSLCRNWEGRGSQAPSKVCRRWVSSSRAWEMCLDADRLFGQVIPVAGGTERSQIGGQLHFQTFQYSGELDFSPAGKSGSSHVHITHPRTVHCKDRRLFIKELPPPTAPCATSVLPVSSCVLRAAQPPTVPSLTDCCRYLRHVRATKVMIYS